VRMNAPATPTMTAFNIVGILIPLAMPNTIIPAIKDARDLWSLRTGTESRTLLILGTKNGAIKLALITAMMLSSNTTPLMFLATLVTICTIKESVVIGIYLSAKKMVVPE